MPKTPSTSPSYTEAVGQAICRDVEGGVPLPEAFLCNGVPMETGAHWRGTRQAFAHELAVAHARYLRSLIHEIREAVAGSGARHDWRASLALLERADRTVLPAESGETESHPVFTAAQMADLQARRRAATGRQKDAG